MAAAKEKVLILGGGFGGIKTALELAQDSSFSVTLLSDQENFRFYPALYRTAVGGKHTASSIPLTEIFEGHNVVVIKDKAREIHRHSKNVLCSSGKTYTYDVLVVALGVVTNYFGIKGLDKFSYGIKTLDEAQELRDHIHQQLVYEQKPDINYVVIGGGPTGVELVAALPAYVRHIMERHGLETTNLHIDLVEAERRLMPRMPKSYSWAIARRLRRLGIKLYLGQKVQAETAQTLTVSGKSIASRTVVWTAGVTNHPFLKTNNFVLSDRGKAVVDEYLQAEPDIYVIGDNADTPYSGMAQTAMYDGKFLAENLVRGERGQAPKAYRPKKPVYVTPAGPRWAAVLWQKLELHGWLGWVLRTAADLIGYHDLEPWWKASKHWLAEAESEESCMICNNKSA